MVAGMPWYRNFCTNTVVSDEDDELFEQAVDTTANTATTTKSCHVGRRRRRAFTRISTSLRALPSAGKYQ
jgi:hypothetical protein